MATLRVVVHFLVLISLVFHTSESVNDDDDVLVKLPAEGGLLQGVSFESSPGGPTYYAFKGIPYAKPPIGNLRFKAPQPYGIFDGTFLANKDGSVCPQLSSDNSSVIGDEDCLTLNVFIHQKPVKGPGTIKFPVIVIFHDGAFQRGSSSSDTLNPRRFLDREIIVVTLNYRLGALGFLSTNDEACPGNFGLLDQVEALRWVQKNIAAFGGDVNQVTLFGYEAGAASGLYHLLSPLSKGLFHRVIALGGSPVCDTSIQKAPFDLAKQLGEDLEDCHVPYPKPLVNCLRKMPVNEIIINAHKLHTLGGKFPLTFLPVVERVFKEHGDFLPDTPINLLKEGKVNKAPVILGVGNYQGQKLFRDVFPDGGNSRNKETFFKKTLPDLLKITTHLKHYHEKISEAIQNTYYPEEDDFNDDQTFQNITTQLFNDFLVGSCLDKTAKYLSLAGWPTYMYTSDKLPSPSNDEEYPDELQYLLEAPNQLKGDSLEHQMKIRRIILSIWSNFAKTSMPTPTKSPDLPLTWMPLNPGKIRYLKVDFNSLLVEGSINERISFWNNKVPKIETGQLKDEL